MLVRNSIFEMCLCSGPSLSRSWIMDAYLYSAVFRRSASPTIT